MSPISKAKFSLDPLTEGSYAMQIAFYDAKDSLVSSKKFTFTPPREGGVASTSQPFVDIFCLNTTCEKVKALESATLRDCQETARSIGKVQKENWKGCNVFVIDVQAEQEACYVNEEIVEAERVLCNQLFSHMNLDQIPLDKEEWRRVGPHRSRAIREPHLAYMQKIFQEKGVPNIVIYEGSLKKELLEKGGFSTDEQRFLQSKDAELASSVLLCQVAEIFMNAFKFDHTAQAESTQYIFSAEKYCKVPLAQEPVCLPRCLESRVLYSSIYKDVYAVNSYFVKELQKVFCIQGQFDPDSEITTLVVQEKKSCSTT